MRQATLKRDESGRMVVSASPPVGEFYGLLGHAQALALQIWTSTSTFDWDNSENSYFFSMFMDVEFARADREQTLAMIEEGM